MSILLRVLGISVLCIAAAAAASPARAQFYEGKTLTLMVNYAAGGTTDVAGRVFARHLPRYLKGEPTVIVANRPGAGGLVGLSYLGSGAVKPDGLTACFCVVNVVAPIIGHAALKVTYDKFIYIGGAAEVNLAYGRRDIPPGMTSNADLAKAQTVFAAGYNPTAVQDIRLKFSLDLLGVKYQMITGFRGANKVLQAIAQKEANFAATSVSGYISQVKPNLVATGVAMPFFYFPMSREGGGYYAVKEIEAMGIPSFHDYYVKLRGEPPSGPVWNAFQLINDLGSAMLRAVLLQTAAPRQAVDELRAAIAGLAGDERFLKEYTRINGLPPDMVDSERGTRLLERLNKVEPETAAILKKIVAQK